MGAGMMVSCAAVLFLGNAAFAGEYDPCGFLSTVCEGSAMNVRFYVGGGSELPQMVGYDLYRSVLGTCGPETRLTDQPWPRVFSDTVYHLIDPVITPGHKNVYRIVGVDAARNQINLFGRCAFNFNAHENYVGCGPAPAAHGTVSSFGPTLLVESCDPCYSGTWRAWEWPPSLVPYIGSGIPLLLYGDQGCQGEEGCGMSIDSFVEQPCTVGVHPMRWGQVKTLYN